MSKALKWSPRSADQFLVTVDAALNALAGLNSPVDLINLANKAEAFRRYAQRAKLGLLAQNRCAELRLRAERKLGELLATTSRLRGRPKSVQHDDTLPSLADLGIDDRRLSHRVQKLATIPSKLFEGYLAEAHRIGWEITTRALIHVCDRRQAAAKNRRRIVGGRVDDLVAFARAGNRVGCLYIDPPWHVPGVVLPYLSVTPDELQNLPIPELAADRCHLHLWTMANDYMFGARDIIHAWGFRIVSSFVWCKPSLGKGNYWRMSHELMLTAVRSAEDRFDDAGLRSWIEAPRGRHSEKPAIIRELIERASPPPRLEIYARTLTPGWYAWGHEIEQPLTTQHVALGGG